MSNLRVGRVDDATGRRLIFAETGSKAPYFWPKQGKNLPLAVTYRLTDENCKRFIAC
jgi:hypothetical protein